uniref:Cyclin N-terminal domain-containing protein n=1 Tax=Macrostomum lignano TaxID=282301 RepID=A0A1I8FEY5_9PLAT
FSATDALLVLGRRRSCSTRPLIGTAWSRQTESKYRLRRRPSLSCNAAKTWGSHVQTIATGIVFFHRFYMAHSFKKYDRYVRRPKLCRDLVRSVQKHLDERTFAAHFASQTQGRSPAELVMQTEALMLRTLKFDFIVEHPYKHLLEMGRRLRGSRRKSARLFAARLGIPCSGSPVLQWSPRSSPAPCCTSAACAAASYSGLGGPLRSQRQVGSSSCPGSGRAFPVIERICHRILDMYQSNNSAGSVPAAVAIATVTIIIANSIGNGRKRRRS